MPYTLKTQEVVVCGETLVVSQASNMMDINRALLIRDAEKTRGEGTEDSTYLQYIKTLLYPSLKACTTGAVPTLEQFLNDVPVEESDLWVEAATQLNPRWFSFLKQEDSDEKKD
jgi:hypothetical protein